MATGIFDSLLGRSAAALESGELLWAGCTPLIQERSGEQKVRRYASADDLERDLGLSASSGDRSLDEQINSTLIQLSEAFRLEKSDRPLFQFIRAPIAVAVSVDSQSAVGETRGLVALSPLLVLSESDEKQRRIVSSVILAHEFAHIYQRRTTLYGQLTRFQDSVKLVELCADYLAGWYMNRLADLTVPQVGSIANAIFRQGDNLFRNPQHHGTPEERYAAVIKGFAEGERGSGHVAAAASNALSYIREAYDL